MAAQCVCVLLLLLLLSTKSIRQTTHGSGGQNLGEVPIAERRSRVKHRADHTRPAAPPRLPVHVQPPLTNGSRAG